MYHLCLQAVLAVRKVLQLNQKRDDYHWARLMQDRLA